MPTRIYPVRPLRGRGYYGAQQQQHPYAGAFKAGSSFGQELVSGIGKAMAARKAQQQQDALNAQANQMENTVTPPRAGAVGPVVNPATGQVTGNITPTVGTAPFSTGAAGMKLQQDFIRSSLENQRLAQEVRNQGIASSMAARRGGGGGGAGNASRWQEYLGKGGQGGQGGQGGKAGKPAAYVPGSSTADNPTDYYNFDHQRQDIDHQYGKGTYDKLLAGAGAISIDPKTGKYVSSQGDVTNPDTGKVTKGNVNVNPDTGEVSLRNGASIPYNELQSNMTRYDGTLVHQGKTPRFNDAYLSTQNPASGLPNGDAANPFLPKDNGQLDAIAPGKSYIDPTDGKVYQKSAPQKPATQQPPAKGSAQVDTSAEGGGLAGAQMGAQMGALGQGAIAGQPQTQGPSLLQPLSAGQPQTPQQGLAAGDSGQDYTGGQPQLSAVAPGPQPPVDVASLNPSNTPGSFFPGATPSSAGLPSDVDLSSEIARTQLASRLQGVA